MARILFAHGHLLRFDAKQFSIGKPYPPLATLFAASKARAVGHEVALFDPMLDLDASGFQTALDHVKPEVLVIYEDSFNWFTKMCLSRMREVAWEMAREGRARNLLVIASGHDAADHPDLYLDAGADFVLAGEGEISLTELLACQEADKAVMFAKVASKAPNGLVFRHEGIERRTPPRKALSNLDELPLPAWDLVDIERYRAFWLARHGYFSLNVISTRGCPYRCNWCAKPVYGNTYHSRSPENVASEIRMLRERYKPDHLWFCDDILGLKARWLMPWSQLMHDEGLAIPFLCQSRADLMTEENVAALGRAGCAEVWLGAESGAQRILDAMDKGITVEQTRLAAQRLKAAGIRVALFLQFGYGDEEWSDIQATRALVRDVVPDDIGISVSYPLPGTRYHELVKLRLGAKRTWRESNDLDPLIERRYSQKFYQTLSRLVHAELRVQRSVVAIRTLLRDPFGVEGTQLRRASQVRHAARWLVDRVRLEASRRAST